MSQIVCLKMKVRVFLCGERWNDTIDRLLLRRVDLTNLCIAEFLV